MEQQAVMECRAERRSIEWDSMEGSAEQRCVE